MNVAVKRKRDEVMRARNVEHDNPKMASSRILVIGLDAGGADSLPQRLLNRIAGADLLVGGKRHLSYFPDFAGSKLAVTTNIELVTHRLQQALDKDEQVIVLASGDPLCYGIGASLRRAFPPELLEIVPAPTAFQLAFAALAEPWSDAALLSAHARPLPDVVAGVQIAPKAAILTDHQHTPVVVARALLEAGLPPDLSCAICENLGAENQRIIRTQLGRVAEGIYAPLNVFVVWNHEADKRQTGQNKTISVTRPSTQAPMPPIPPGLPDDAFSTTAAQITKREVRLLSLAELALRAGEVMWDIGAGSGSVGIEAARAQPLAQVYAVEKRAELCQHLRENLCRFPAPNLCLTEGVAPDAIMDWPAPQAVFIGGSGGRLKELIKLVQQRLYLGGRLVINLATLENLQMVRAHLPQAQVIQVQINRGVSILNMTRFEGLNPIFIVTWRKE